MGGHQHFFKSQFSKISVPRGSLGAPGAPPMGPRGGPRAPQWVQGDPLGGSQGPPGTPWGSYGIQPRDPWAPPRDPEGPPRDPMGPPLGSQGGPGDPGGKKYMLKSKSGMNDRLIQPFELKISPL